MEELMKEFEEIDAFSEIPETELYKELKEKLGIPKYPDMIREEDVNQIVKWAQKEANPIYPVPEIWDAQEMKEFVLAMMEGARLEGAEKNE